MPLQDDDIRSVLARADEIQRNTQDGVALHAELEAVIEAAEAVGIPRPAVERALRERLGLPASPPAVGDLAFAKSADGKFYVAEIVAAAQSGFRVRFLSGGEHTLEIDELRSCSMVPGERVVVAWPWWGPWTCTVVSYDAAQRQLTVNDGWGETRTFPLAEVWLNPPRTASSRTRARVYATLLGAGATLGAIVGSVLTALVLR